VRQLRTEGRGQPEAHRGGGARGQPAARRLEAQALRRLIASVVWTLPAVQDLRTYAVMEEVKSTTRIPI
jgi:Lrp/AsnC family leucine-responsive transcriptional regulator